MELVQIRTSRSSGPGGQHANVTASRVEVSIVLDSRLTAGTGEAADAGDACGSGPNRTNGPAASDSHVGDASHRIGGQRHPHDVRPHPDPHRLLSDAELQRLQERFGKRVTASAQDTRSQLRNRELALDRLASRIEQALRTEKPRRPTRPSRASVNKRIENKRRRGQLKKGRRASGHED